MQPACILVHMTPHLADFSKFNPTKRGVVDIADNSQMAYEGEGEEELAVLNSEGEEIEVTLKEVLYSPSLATRLFSEEYSSQRGAVLIRSKDHFSVLIPDDGIEIPLLTTSNGRFLQSQVVVHPPPSTSPNPSAAPAQAVRGLDIWHERLGHNCISV